MLAWAWWRGFLGLALLDVCAVPLALGYAIGRIGCQLSGDGDYGKAWSGPWAMAYPHGTVPTTRDGPPDADLRDARDGARRLGAVAAAATASGPGSCSRSTWCASGLERFLVEFLRRNDHVVGRPDGPQLESLVLMVAGAVWLLVVARRGGLTPGAEPAGRAGRVAPAQARGGVRVAVGATSRLRGRASARVRPGGRRPSVESHEPARMSSRPATAPGPGRSPSTVMPSATATTG